MVAYFLLTAMAAINLWGSLQFGMSADDVRTVTPNKAVEFSPYCQARVEPVLADGHLVAVKLVSQSSGISPEDQKQTFQIVPCETDFRRHLARQFGKAVDASFMADEPMKITSRSRIYVRNCVVAQLHLSHLPDRPSEILFRVPRDGEFSVKSGTDETKPLACHSSEG